MQFKSIFSFYGGKSKLAHLYPKPKREWIIEPFAGGAAYSALHSDKNIQLYDADPGVAAIWQFLLQKDWPATLAFTKDLVPTAIDPGTKVSRLLADKLHWQEGQELNTMELGLLRLLQAEANCGTQGAKGIHDQVTWMAAKQWGRIIPRLAYWLPRINHWKFIKGDYTEAPNTTATWFVDPPYNNAAGKRYRQQVPDYAALAEWCTARKGDIIICENEGATWPGSDYRVVNLRERLGVTGRYQKSRAVEVMFVRQRPPTRLSQLFDRYAPHQYAAQYIRDVTFAESPSRSRWTQVQPLTTVHYDQYVDWTRLAEQFTRSFFGPGTVTVPATNAEPQAAPPNPSQTTNGDSTNGSS